MRRKARADSNQPELTAALRQVGWHVELTHACHNIMDALAARRGVLRIVEFKKGKGGYTPDQIQFMQQMRDHGVEVRTIRTVEDALRMD